MNMFMGECWELLKTVFWAESCRKEVDWFLSKKIFFLPLWCFISTLLPFFHSILDILLTLNLKVNFVETFDYVRVQTPVNDDA